MSGDDRRAELWPGVDLDELVPRGVAYRELYESLGRAAAERTAYTHAACTDSRRVLAVEAEWQAAGLRAAARIAHDVYVELGNWARARAALLPRP